MCCIILCLTLTANIAFVPFDVQGYTTFYVKSVFEIRGTGFVWRLLERSFPPHVKDAVKGMRLCKDSMVRGEGVTMLGEGEGGCGGVSVSCMQECTHTVHVSAFHIRRSFGGGLQCRVQRSICLVVMHAPSFGLPLCRVQCLTFPMS